MTLLDFMCIASADEIFDICDEQCNSIDIITNDTNIKDYSKFINIYGNKQVKSISTYSSGGFQVKIDV